MGKTFEIWSKERYDAMMTETLTNFDAIAQGMGALGL